MSRALPIVLLGVLSTAVALHGGVTPAAGLLLQLLVAAAGLGVACQRRLPEIPTPARALPLLWAGLALASLAWSENRDATLDAASAVLATGLVFLLATLLPGRRARRRLYGGLAALGALVACVALASVRPGDQAAFPFRNPNHLASWLLLPGAVGLVATLSERLSERGRREDALLWFGLAATVGAALAATSSLGASLAVAAGLVALPLLRWDPRRGAALVGLGFLGVFGLLAILPVLRPDLLPLAHSGSESSPGMRWAVYAASARAALAAAPLGVGLGGFDAAFASVRPSGLPYAVRYAHSEPLQGLVELGAPFLVLCVLTTVLLSAQLGRRLADSRSPLPWGAGLAVLALAAHCLVEFSLHVPAVALCAAALAGTLWPTRSHQAASRGAFATRIACATLSCALLALAGSGSVATWYGERAERALAAGRFDAAQRAAERGLRARPARAGLHTRAAEAAEHAYRFGGGGELALARALEARRRAVRASRLDASLRLAAARTLLLAGRSGAALQELGEAARLDPRSPVPQLAMFRLQLQTGDRGAAGASLREALERHPPAAGDALGALLRQGEDPALARAALPSTAPVHRAAAAVLSRDGYLLEAAEEYARALLRAPGDVGSALAAAQHFLRAGELGRAESVLLRALAEQPGNPDLQQTLAALRSRRAVDEPRG